jgi:tetraacyldisaccharide 4'-kinase
MLPDIWAISTSASPHKAAPGIDPPVSFNQSLHSWLQRQWYDTPVPSPLLRGLEKVFIQAVRARQTAYHNGHKQVDRLPVPVIVVGNLTVGGTGKTPVTLWLVNLLKQHGYRPGIISRGYGGKKHSHPLIIGPDTTPEEAGDEPVLISSRSYCPVCIHPRRAQAGRTLLAASDCDILIADDGLQHYALARDLEIAVVDGARGFGNGHCLPAGPLREPPARLETVDWVIYSGNGPEGSIVMTLVGDTAVNLANPKQHRPLGQFAEEKTYAVAGIGHPKRFFDDLQRWGLTLESRAFPDHHSYQREDLAFAGSNPLLMTEKDAVKCRRFASTNHWYIPVQARLPDAFGEQLLNQLKIKTHGQKTA